MHLYKTTGMSRLEVFVSKTVQNLYEAYCMLFIVLLSIPKLASPSRDRSEAGFICIAVRDSLVLMRNNK